MQYEGFRENVEGRQGGCCKLKEPGCSCRLLRHLENPYIYIYFFYINSWLHT